MKRRRKRKFGTGRCYEARYSGRYGTGQTHGGVVKCTPGASLALIFVGGLLGITVMNALQADAALGV